jgi:hypothetical protein
MERIQQERYDIAVVGGGAAGCMAAIQASYHGTKVVLLERKPDIGRKILLTGNGRCNLTNKSPLPVFLEKFGRRGSFFRSAFSSFSSDDLINFFEKSGLKLKEEDKGRIFPITDRSQSVINVLRAQMEKLQVTVIYNYRVEEIRKADGYFQLSKKTSSNGKGNKQNHNSDHSSEPYFASTYVPIQATRVILATGGASYPQTGSSGDGYHLAHQLGHEILPLKPGLVPLRIKESWGRSWQGVVLKDVGLTFRHGKKGKIMGEGDVLFTHFGVSGPILLDLSQKVVKILDKEGEVSLFLDLMPTTTREKLEDILLDDFKKHSKRDLQNYLRSYLPSGFIKTFLEVLDIDPHKKLNQVDRKQRIKLVDNIKGFKLTVNGHLPLSKAMITCGGVSRNEIDPETMESRMIPGLYLAGEVIAGCAASGGYNLQQAFSTGFLSARSASESIS